MKCFVIKTPSGHLMLEHWGNPAAVSWLKFQDVSGCMSWGTRFKADRELAGYTAVEVSVEELTK